MNAASALAMKHDNLIQYNEEMHRRMACLGPFGNSTNMYTFAVCMENKHLMGMVLHKGWVTIALVATQPIMSTLAPRMITPMSLRMVKCVTWTRAILVMQGVRVDSVSSNALANVGGSVGVSVQPTLLQLAVRDDIRLPKCNLLPEFIVQDTCDEEI